MTRARIRVVNYSPSSGDFYGVTLTRLTSEMCTQLRDGKAAVRDPVLLVRGQLGHRAAVASDDEQRVVPEALLAAGSEPDLTTHLAVEELDPAVGRGERRHADEARAARLDAIQ